MNNPHDDDLLAALGSLQPEPAEINRDELLYRAGYAAGEAAAARRPAARIWQATAVVATAASLALLLNERPATSPSVAPPSIVSTTPIAGASAWDLDGVLAIRPRPSRRTPDVTPTEYSAVPPLTARTLLEELLNEPQPGEEA